MYLNAVTSRHQTEEELKDNYLKSILKIGDNVLNNVRFNLDKKVDYFGFINAKTLINFDNNLTLTNVLFSPKVIKKLLVIPSSREETDIINNITQEINNNYYPDTGELVEDQW